MIPVLRLTILYFAATRLHRWLTISSGALIGLGIVGLWKYAAQYSPVMTPGHISRVSADSLAFSALLWLIPIIGVLVFFLSAAMLPVVFGHFAQSRQLHILPYGRVRLLASALLTLSLVAAVFGVIVKALYISFPVVPAAVFAKSFAYGLLTFSAMYLLIWVVSRAKGSIGSLSGAMLIIPSLALPFRVLQFPQPPVSMPIAVGLSIGAACCGAFLWAPRWRGWTFFAGLSLRSSDQPPRALTPGREFAVLAGVARPWMLGAGLILPIAVATLFIRAPGIWLCYFMLCSVISGGISSQCVPRSRALWLRGPWSRLHLFTRMEHLFWGQNSYCLSVLIVLLVAVGSSLRFPTALLAVGIPLLVVGCAAGTYLGLMMTRGIGWPDGLCAGSTMVLMLGIALYALNLSYPVLAGMYAGLAVLAVTLRSVARRRWANLDWMLCRAPAPQDSQAI